MLNGSGNLIECSICFAVPFNMVKYLIKSLYHIFVKFSTHFANSPYSVFFAVWGVMITVDRREKGR